MACTTSMTHSQESKIQKAWENLIKDRLYACACFLSAMKQIAKFSWHGTSWLKTTQTSTIVMYAFREARSAFNLCSSVLVCYSMTFFTSPWLHWPGYSHGRTHITVFGRWSSSCGSTQRSEQCASDHGQKTRYANTELTRSNPLGLSITGCETSWLKLPVRPPSNSQPVSLHGLDFTDWIMHATQACHYRYLAIVSTSRCSSSIGVSQGIQAQTSWNALPHSHS